MAKYKRIVTTEAGLELLAKAYESETTIMFTAVKTGNGIYDGTEDLSGATALKSVKQSFGLSGVSRTGAQVKVRSVLSNNGVTSGYDITEIGLYAKNPDSAEILYAIIVAETGLEDYLPPFEETPTSITLEMYIAIAEEQSKVTFAAEIVAGTYVAVEDFQDHVSSERHITAAERTAWNNKLDKTATAANSEKLNGHGAEYFALAALLNYELYGNAKLTTPISECASYTDLFSQIPEKSVFIGSVWYPPSWFPSNLESNYRVFVCKQTNGIITIEVIRDGGIAWVATYDYGTTWSGWKKITMDTDLSDYLPLTGGVISGTLAVASSLVAYATIYANGDVSDNYGGLMLMKAPNVANIGSVLVRPYNNGIMFYNNNTDWRGARLDMTKCGTNQSSEILHTGISIPVVPSETEPTDTTALWIDTKNLKIKKYINSTWTEL